MPRIENKKLIEFIKTLPCIHCNQPADHAHHVSSRGAGGHDLPENLMPLCFTSHRMIHDKGIDYMATNFPSIAEWLRLAGWSKDPVLLRWRHAPYRVYNTNE